MMLCAPELSTSAPCACQLPCLEPRLLSKDHRYADLPLLDWCGD